MHNINALTGIKFNLACAVNDITGKSYFHTHEFLLNLVQQAPYLPELRLFENNMTLFDHIVTASWTGKVVVLMHELTVKNWVFLKIYFALFLCFFFFVFCFCFFVCFVLFCFVFVFVFWRLPVWCLHKIARVPTPNSLALFWKNSEGAKALKQTIRALTTDARSGFKTSFI